MNNSVSSLKQLRELQKNDQKSLQYIIDEAYRILGNPIILYDIDYKILAYPESVVTDDPIWNNHINGAIEVSREIYINEGFVHIMTGPDKVVFLMSDHLKYHRIFGKIFDKENSLIAGVSVVASNKPFEDDDLMVTDALCKILPSVISKIPYYQYYANKKNDAYIGKLIDRDYTEKTYVIGSAEIIYKGLKKNLYAAVADVSKCDPTYAKLDHYRDLFKQMQPGFKCAIYQNHIVILISSNSKDFNSKIILKELRDYFKRNDIYVGISTCFENLFELPGYYAEAVKALNERERSGNQHIVQYNREML